MINVSANNRIFFFGYTVLVRFLCGTFHKVSVALVSSFGINLFLTSYHKNFHVQPQSVTSALLDDQNFLSEAWQCRQLKGKEMGM